MRLLVEWLHPKRGVWFGSNDPKYATLLGFYVRAVDHLTETPDRYYYPPEFCGRVRASIDNWSR